MFKFKEMRAYRSENAQIMGGGKQFFSGQAAIGEVKPVAGDLKQQVWIL